VVAAAAARERDVGTREENGTVEGECGDPEGERTTTNSRRSGACCTRCYREEEERMRKRKKETTTRRRRAKRRTSCSRLRARAERKRW
jgi:hypothetical protein